ncbi:hypothetical protein PISMIDRAFT_463860 [Pisolithus microcarpus 441]|uniref:Uncharacterized protein n=1 Tax=Pisolithus microcarpus 441 TaxID=765257 RepID=A0A0C9YE49_9AGAM|nr:hypothetical protein PISMIDRAFT_463860 [Pisolithus microcarpus 441]
MFGVASAPAQNLTPVAVGVYQSTRRGKFRVCETIYRYNAVTIECDHRNPAAGVRFFEEIGFGTRLWFIRDVVLFSGPTKITDRLTTMSHSIAAFFSLVP